MPVRHRYLLRFTLPQLAVSTAVTWLVWTTAGLNLTVYVAGAVGVVGLVAEWEARVTERRAVDRMDAHGQVPAGWVLAYEVDRAAGAMVVAAVLEGEQRIGVDARWRVLLRPTDVGRGLEVVLRPRDLIAYEEAVGVMRSLARWSPGSLEDFVRVMQQAGALDLSPTTEVVQ